MELKTYSLTEHLDLSDEQINHLIDMESVPVPQRRDYFKRNDNVLSGRTLCGACDGTGNEHFWSYKQCKECKGSGHTVPVRVNP